MATTAKAANVSARTGAEYLAGLGADDRELWLNGERVRQPLDHEDLRCRF